MLDKWLPQPLSMDNSARHDFGLDSNQENKTVTNHSFQEFADFPDWDSATLFHLVGDDPVRYRYFLEKFLATANKQQESLHAAVAAGDAAAVGNTAHAFKSAARIVGAMRLGELCQALEKAGKAGDNTECKALASRLDEILDIVQNAIKKQLAA